LAFVVLLVFDLLPARFGVVFDLTRRFDEVLDLVRFFAFFMLRPIRFNLAHIGPQSVCWQATGDDFLSLIRGRTNPKGAAARTAWGSRGEHRARPHCVGLATARAEQLEDDTAVCPLPDVRQSRSA
jgi:hypothetical protein